MTMLLEHQALSREKKQNRTQPEPPSTSAEAAGDTSRLLRNFLFVFFKRGKKAAIRPEEN